MEIWNNKIEYYNWILRMVDQYGNVQQYSSLLKTLHDIPFTYLMDDDYNRYMDGISIRYEFAWRHFIPYTEIASAFEDKEPSVLEVMFALAYKLAHSFASDPESTPVIFWAMINHLGLIEMTDDRFDYNYVQMIIGKFLNRMYCRDGQGGLFVIFGDEDATRLTLWQQACRYMNSQNSR